MSTRKSISSLLCELKWCSQVRSLDEGRRIHAEVVRNGFESNMFLGSALVHMYSKCGSLVDAKRMFDRMVCHDLVAWSALILGYAENGEEELALNVFMALRLPPNGQVCVAALKACVNLGLRLKNDRLKALDYGMAVHVEAIRNRCDEEMIVLNSLVDMYAKCGSLGDCRRAFDRGMCHNVVTWTSLILGYTDNGEEEVALELFERLPLPPDPLTFAAALHACTRLAAKEEVEAGGVVKLKSLDRGLRIHAQAFKLGFDRDDTVGNSLVDMYAKCGSMFDSRTSFDRLPEHSVVSWTALLLGHTHNGQGDLALELFTASEGPLLNLCEPAVYLAVLKACCSMGSLDSGRRVHAQICRLGMESDPVLESCLVDVYGKCGNMLTARLAFDASHKREPLTWSSLISGYSRQGDSEQVFSLVHEMQEEGVELDGVTYLSVLAVCSHAGLVEEGEKKFKEMRTRHGISPGPEHYHCLVDMLSRGSQLEEAVGVVKSMPFKPTAVTWGSVLANCRKWKNPAVASMAFESMLELGDEQGLGCTLMLSQCNTVCPNSSLEYMKKRER